MTLKIAILIVVLSVSNVLAIPTYSQVAKVSLDMGNRSLEQVMDEIERQSEFYFIFNQKQIDVNRIVNIQEDNKLITDILPELFAGTNVNYVVFDRKILLTTDPIENSLLAIASGTELQQNIVKGTVTDDKGNPLTGVTVMVKGTTRGTTTDINGNYIIEADNAQSILVLSFIGYKNQEVTVGNRTQINITLLEEVVGLDEVIVIGYGTVKKRNLTGSVSSIKSEAFQARAITSLGEAFAGQLAGVRAQQSSGEPGRELSITIRGVHTISASNEPLYVLDGVPVSSMQGVNPNDIESIEVLKDASSAAIYGSRGANGVVLITTKQGTEGKPIFNFEANYGLQKADGKYDLMNKEEFLAYNMWAKNFAYILQGGSMSDPMSMRPAGLQIPAAWIEDPESLPNIDWQDKVFGGLHPQQNYNLSVSGGGNLGNFLISAGHLRQEGIVVATDFERSNLRSNTVLNVGKNLRIGMNIASSFSKKHKGGIDGPFMGAYFPPIIPIDANTQATGYPTSLTYVNPIEKYKQTHDENKSTIILNNVWGELKVIESLLFKTQMGYNYEQNSNTFFLPSNVNQGNPSTGSANVSRNYNFSLQNILEYTPKISPLLDMSLMLGQSFEDNKYSYVSADATNYPNDLIYTLNVAGSKTGASTTEAENILSSFFGRLRFSLNNKYLLTANIRRDGSSKFGRDTKWGWFPSLALAWKIDQEKFMQNIDWLDMLKIRLTIGKVGNDRIGNYEHISLAAANNYNFNGTFVNGLAPSSMANPLLGWETKVSSGIGLDFNGFNNRVQANLDFYNDNTKDMLLNANIPLMTGFSSFRTNIGEIRNRGLEFELTTQNIRGQFTWITSFNIGRNFNKVLKLGEDGAPIINNAGRAGTDNTWITKIGEPIASLYLWEVEGVLLPEDFDDDGKPLVPIYSGQRPGNSKLVDHNNDGIINELDKIPAGNGLPDFIFGLNNRFAYKNFDLNLLFQAQLGAEIFHISWRYWDSGGSGMSNYMRRWLRSYKADYLLPEGEDPYPETDIDLSWDGKLRVSQSLVGVVPLNTTDNMYDASFLRIKNLTIGYNLPKHMSEKIGLVKVRIYFTGDNLYTWDRYIGPSPEGQGGQNDGSANELLTTGGEMAAYGIARKYSFGINLTF